MAKTSLALGHDFSVSNTEKTLQFSKIQALGNDFIFLSKSELESFVLDIGIKELDLAILSNLSKTLCHRHFGIGADGLVIVEKNEVVDLYDLHLKWLFYNSDGSQSFMCGNALRCLPIWLLRSGKLAVLIKEKIQEQLLIKIDTGKSAVEVIYESENKITSDLGAPALSPHLVPVKVELAEELCNDFDISANDALIEKSIDLGLENRLKISCLSMGNPHCILFVDSNKFIDLSCHKELQAISDHLQKHELFPEGVNVEFVEIVNKNYAKIIVYERGCGKTLACASGAAAVLVAGVHTKRLDCLAQIELPGGLLEVSYDLQSEHVKISGPATFVYSGEISLSSLEKMTSLNEVHH